MTREMTDINAEPAVMMAAAGWRRCLAGVLLGLAACLSGCGSDSDDGQGSAWPGPLLGAPGAASSAAVCGTADLSGLTSIVYVSTDGSDDAGCGKTTTGACASIQQGIKACPASGCGVLVRHGLYSTSATIELRDAVNVYGGCRFDDEPLRRYRTVVAANPAPGTPAVSATGIDSATHFSGVVVIGKNETAAGTASIAMAVSNSRGLSLAQVSLVAGQGGDGGHGTSSNGDVGEDGHSPGCPTCRGAPGRACPSNPPPAGVGGGGAGAGQNNIATSGCFLDCHCWTNNGGDAVGLPGQGSGGAQGGTGSGPGTSGCMCDDRPRTFGVVDPSAGLPGSPGAAGQCGTQGGTAAASTWGQFDTNGVWVGTAGQQAIAGSVGAGGGGGGSGGYATSGRPGGVDLSGYPGGGGGGGGCGGPGGGAGQQGGASIALLLSAANIAAVDAGVSIVAGPGGRGGTGGQGGIGGAGGRGGKGYISQQYHYLVVARCEVSAAPGLGGLGGAGGPGGAGSGGAGGNGGASIGVALRAASIVPAAAIVYPPAPGGAGGSRGAGGQNAAIPGIDPNPCRAADGQNGHQGGSIAIQDFDRLPLYPGQQLPKGQVLLSPDGNVQLNMQADDNLCLYLSGRNLWCSGTSNKTGITAALMQTDGNLCMYPTDNSGPWCSGTQGHPGAYLTVLDSGHVRIVDVDGTPLWTKP